MNEVGDFFWYPVFFSEMGQENMFSNDLPCFFYENEFVNDCFDS